MRTWACSVLVLIAIANSATGQNSSPTRVSPPPSIKQTPNKPKPAAKPVEVDQSAIAPEELLVGGEAAGIYRVDELGMILNLPPDCQAYADRISAPPPGLVPAGTTAAKGQVSVKVFPKEKSGTWLINFRNASPKDPTMSTSDFAQAVFDATIGFARAKSADTGIQVEPRVLKRDTALIVCGRPAERFYLSYPQPEGRPAMIQGATIFKMSGGEFAIFTLDTTATNYAQDALIYETFVAGTRFENIEAANGRRKLMFDTGSKLFSSLSEDDFKSLIAHNTERWERLYHPTATGSDKDADEVGYRRIRVSLGKRGDLVTSEDSQVKNPDQPGYVVRVDARFIQNAGKAKADTIGTFFLSLNRKEEAWVVTTAAWDEGRSTPAVRTEIGARTDRSMEVQIQGGGHGIAKTAHPLVPPDGYISRVEAFLLPQILVQKKITADFAFYAYNSEAERIQIRRDSLTQPGDKPGVYLLTTKISDDGNMETSYFKESGDPIRATTTAGYVWEPSSLESLKNIWTSKGLPLN